MKLYIIIFGLLIFIALAKAIVNYPNFVESLNLPPIKFPNEKTKTTTEKPPQTIIAPMPIYVPVAVVPAIPVYPYPYPFFV